MLLRNSDFVLSQLSALSPVIGGQPPSVTSDTELGESRFPPASLLQSLCSLSISEAAEEQMSPRAGGVGGHCFSPSSAPTDGLLRSEPPDTSWGKGERHQ